MTFTPTPGVKYAVVVGEDANGYPEHVEWIYSPWWSSDPEPWIDEDGESHAWKPEYKIFDIAYNPHPPTRTEWRASGRIGVSEPQTGPGAVEYLRKNRPSDRLERREVTEWVEVADA